MKRRQQASPRRTLVRYRPVLRHRAVTTSAVRRPWNTEGPGSKVILNDVGQANHGNKSALLSSPDPRVWNALTRAIPVRPHTDYKIIGFFRTLRQRQHRLFGVRLPGVWPPVERHFGPAPAYCPPLDPACYSQITVSFNSGDHTTATAFAGFWGVGQPATLQIDDIRVLSS
ncbi:hypothetical protein [Streptomyces sp. 2231.1]|uniref:hypothetical protein n=1 Tax=Streptomyces sp. 2231.1 TaxID=1855347 RepID=UPI000B80AB1F|nr:hypothetical protein [Streptomyces sp. 2231.1]